jgi:hypothetical protein
VVVFLLALSVRVALPASKYTVWYERSLGFWEALLQGDLVGTYQRHHPGVSAMWIAGAAIRLYMAGEGWSTSEMLDLPQELSGPQGLPVRLGAGSLGLTIALAVAMAYVLLCQLTNSRQAFVAGCLLALDPFHIAHSNMIHLDALLAAFMLLSALFLIRYLRGRATGHLVASAFFGGLALLTKSPALFLIPYTCLIVAIDLLVAGRSLGPPAGRRWPERIALVLRSLAVWGLVAVAVFFLFWPAMWVQPLGTLGTMMERGALRHAGQTHPFLQFFLGEDVRDPGLLYYPASVAWKTTFVTLPGFMLAIWALLRSGGPFGCAQGRREDRRVQWYLLILVVAFLVQMSLGAKKLSRYILPVFPALDVLAAWGLVQGARAASLVLSRLTNVQARPAIVIAVLALALPLHAVAVLSHHPYYGTHYNRLLGGSRVAQHVFQLGDQGEGLDLAAEFLSAKPGAGFLIAGVCDPGNLMFRENFVGGSKPINHPDADYRVFYINDVQRAARFEHCTEYWHACLEQGPGWMTSFGHVPYVWICAAYPQDIDAYAVDRRVDAQLGEHIELLGYVLDSDGLASSDGLTVTLIWRSDGGVVADNHVFVHLLGEGGELVAQHDGVPGSGRPTWSWQDGEVVADSHRLVAPEGAIAASASYTVTVGMYDHATKARLQVAMRDGSRPADDRIRLESIRATSR